MNLTLTDIETDIRASVKTALIEDIGTGTGTGTGTGDITAQLIPHDKRANAEIITREACIMCGQAWLDETFKQLGGLDRIEWLVNDGDTLKAGDTLVKLEGNARTLLTGERTALNFIQLLSAVATKANNYVQALGQSKIRILDTRKTIPGLRTAQKYAVVVGGCHNHRIGLYDAFLIKENHIAACGGIQQAVTAARALAPNKTVEIETETLAELNEAIDAGADVAMLDNFTEEMLSEALALDRKSTKFELSGNLTIKELKDVASLNIDYCSFGDLTKNVQAIDLSMRIND